MTQTVGSEEAASIPDASGAGTGSGSDGRDGSEAPPSGSGAVRRSPIATISLVYLTAFVLSLLAPFVVPGGGWAPPAAGAVVGAWSLWNLNGRYRNRIGTRTEGVGRWLLVQVLSAVVGVVLIAFGAWLVRNAAIDNSRRDLAVALGLIIGGMVPVAQVVRADLSRITDRPIGPWAWLINLALVGLATMVPALVADGSRRALVVAGAAAWIWLADVAVARRTPRWWWTLPSGVVVAVLIFGLPVLSRREELPFPLVVAFGFALVLSLLLLGAWLRCRWGASEQSAARSLVLLSMALVLAAAGLGRLLLVVDGGGVDRRLVVLGAVLAFLLGVAQVVRGEGLLTVAALGLLALWAVGDHTVGPFPVAGEGPAVLTFGDSYIAGEGTGRFFDGTDSAGTRSYTVGGPNECHRSPAAYLPLLAAELGLSLSFDACSGAKAMSDELADDLFGAPSSGAPDPAPDAGGATAAAAVPADMSNTVLGQLHRWQASASDQRVRPNVVIVSMGGNDAGFSQIGIACFLPGSCGDAFEAAQEQKLDLVERRVGYTLEQVAKALPGTTIGVVAYPQMFGAAIDRCDGQVPFDSTEAEDLKQFVTNLNEAVGNAITTVNGELGEERVVHLTATVKAFVGHRFCEVDPANGELVRPDAVNRLSLASVEGRLATLRLDPTRLVHNTFHPTSRGYELLRDALMPWMANACYRSDGSTAIVGADGAPTTCRAAAAGDPELDGEVAAQPLVTSAADPDEPSVCGDLDSYVYCSLVSSLQLVVTPVLAIVASGALVAWDGRARLRRHTGPGSRLAGWANGLRWLIPPASES